MTNQLVDLIPLVTVWLMACLVALAWYRQRDKRMARELYAPYFAWLHRRQF